MKITLATDFDSKNINAWSGLGVYYSKMLKQAGFDLDYITNTDLPLAFLKFLKIQYNERVKDKIYSSRYDMSVSKKYGSLVNKRLANGSSIISSNTVILAHAKRNLKKILYTDATFLNLLNSYAGFSKLTDSCLNDAVAIDKLAIQNSNILIYTSQWAADSAIKDYGADPSKVFVIPFGANLDHTPSPIEVKEMILKRNLKSQVNLLFLGVVWERKGGDYALEVTKQLNDVGISARLHITGLSALPRTVDLKYVINHGHISKSTAAGQKKISKLIAQSDFLIMPSIADCTPVSFSESNAFGLPCIVTDVGGHKSVIENGINGTIFSLKDFVENSVAYITSLREKENEYRKLCFSSYERYREELNWEKTGDKISKLIMSS